MAWRIRDRVSPNAGRLVGLGQGVMTVGSDSASVMILISNPLGLHARPAMSFVDTANGFDSDIRVHKGEQVADGKSILKMMMLAATEGTELQVTADGHDAADAIAALQALVDRGFDED